MHTPSPGVQASVVQGFASEQLRGLPALHTPWSHTSPKVHKLPSSQGPPNSGVNTQAPVLGSQPSVVQGWLSLQALAPPMVHTPFLHASPLVQRSPSSHLVLSKGE